MGRSKSIKTACLIGCFLIAPAGYAEGLTAPAGFANGDAGKSSAATSGSAGTTTSASPGAAGSLPASGAPTSGIAGTTTNGSPGAAGVVPAKGAATSAGESNIPDSLKDLIPKQMPDTTGTSTSAAHKALQAMPASVVPKKAAAPIVLKGRLEEIGGGVGARLPAGVVLNLKAETAHLDPSYEKTLAGKIASFPVQWQGIWGGNLKIWTMQMDQAAYQFDTEEAAKNAEMLQPGTEGSVSFNFFRQNNMIALQPAQITFAPRLDNTSYAAKELRSQFENSPYGKLLGGNAGAMISSMAYVTPVMALGNMNGRSATGNIIDSSVVKNDIRQLKPGTIEQDIVTSSSETHHENGKVLRSYVESVLRFTKLNESQLYVQAAVVEYRRDGHFLSKVIFYGTVNKGQGGAADPMAQMQQLMQGGGGFPGTGAFPGLPASGANGGGGMPDLNNLIKQLQGF